MKNTYSFGEELKKRRTEAGVSLERLGAGLYDSNMLSLIEGDIRIPDRLMRNRLMDRLGISVDDYEVYLDEDEYNQWLMRQKIIDALMQEDAEKAERLTEEYERENDMDNKLCLQFTLAMQAECIRMRRVKYGSEQNTELASLYERAVKLTVPDVDVVSLSTICLSAQELNLVLEYASYQKKEERDRLYGEVLSYLENANFDIHNMSKIFPKVVYYICADWNMHYKNANVRCKKIQEYVELCRRAIEILREAHRVYYVLELLDMSLELISEVLLIFERKQAHECDKTYYNELKKRQKEIVDWKKVYAELYEYVGLFGYMTSDAQLYVEGEAYNVSEVIRTRRKMFGMTIRDLAEGVCSERTVIRIESGEFKNHRVIVSELLEKLGIPYELYRTDLITTSYEAKSLRQKFDVCFNKNGGYDKCTEYICKISEIVDVGIPINHQTVELLKCINERAYKKVEDYEYRARIRTILEYTIPYENIINSDNVYLTNNEMKCLKEIFETEKNNMDFSLLDKMCEVYEKLSNNAPVHSYIIMYEFIMNTVAGNYGDRKMYDESDKISDDLLKICLMNRRTQKLPRLIYNNQWNSRMRGGREQYNIIEKKKIDNCIIISRFNKNQQHEFFYYQKLL